MMEIGGLTPCDIPLRQKMSYEAYMQMKPDTSEPGSPTENMNLLNRNSISMPDLSPNEEGI